MYGPTGSGIIQSDPPKPQTPNTIAMMHRECPKDCGCKCHYCLVCGAKEGSGQCNGHLMMR
jgi:hypothetical protein